MHNNKWEKANYTYTTLLYMLFIFTVSCKNNIYIAVPVANKIYQLKADSLNQQTMIDSIMKNFWAKRLDLMQETIGNTALPLTFAQPESSLGNLLADAVWNYFVNKHPLDIVVLSPQIIGLHYLAPGNITIENCIELLPKDNQLIIASLNGLQIQQLSDSIAAMNGMPIAGCNIKINSKKSTTILVAQQMPKEQRLYRVCFNEDLSKQRAFRFLQNTYNAYNSQISLRTALITYFKQINQNKQKLSVPIEQRISYE
jgi:2',3'-cyclic-nucleotide 2'-phosphodiesterase (5'-nucleotidase family)